MSLSKEEAIKILSRYDNPYYTPATRQAHRMGVEALRTQCWIPVTKRLPDEFVSVLVCIPSEHPLPLVKEAYMANNWWTTKFGVYKQSEITHWMPLPEPPKEGNNA